MGDPHAGMSPSPFRSRKEAPIAQVRHVAKAAYVMLSTHSQAIDSSSASPVFSERAAWNDASAVERICQSEVERDHSWHGLCVGAEIAKPLSSRELPRSRG